MSKQPVIPPGFRADHRGHLVPEALIKPMDAQRDALVLELVQQAKATSELIAQFKARCFELADAFVASSAKTYGAKLGGTKGNVTLHSFDGKYKVLVAIHESIAFDERLQAAKALIDECIKGWAEGSRPEIMALVGQAFDTDKAGKLNVGRILGLRRLEIDDRRWQRAMKAISESVSVVGSKRYIRFYERVGDTDQYLPISLDIAGA